uniref:Transthyretin-like family protein n=1 Tax=Angiostrongylus cantonensis TaxID=6313 RepID=A0A0K0CY00_ANGCA
MTPILMDAIYSSFSYGGERNYYVRGRLLCGIQSQAARIILWENRGGQPYIYEETMTDLTGYFRAKAELHGVAGGGIGGWNGFSNGDIMLTINHNCYGQRQLSIDLPPSYWNQGISAMRTFDLGTVNLEGIFSGEEPNRFPGMPRERFGRFGEMILCPSN